MKDNYKIAIGLLLTALLVGTAATIISVVSPNEETSSVSLSSVSQSDFVIDYYDGLGYQVKEECIEDDHGTFELGDNLSLIHESKYETDVKYRFLFASKSSIQVSEIFYLWAWLSAPQRESTGSSTDFKIFSGHKNNYYLYLMLFKPNMTVRDKPILFRGFTRLEYYRNNSVDIESYDLSTKVFETKNYQENL